MPKLVKILLFSLALLFAAYSLHSILFFSPGRAGEMLEAIVFDVGQGDAIFIRTPEEKNILVDGGPDRTILNRLSQALPWWDRGIDLMILTHPHDDHVRGLSEVMENFPVSRILFTGVVHNSPSYAGFLRQAEEAQISLLLGQAGQTVNLDSRTRLEILYPFDILAGQEHDNLNNTSLVLKLVHGNTSMLLAGDIEKEAEDDLLSASCDLKADILKIAHHGSDSSSQEAFLEAVNPGYAVISAGQDNKFGHPSRRVEKRLEDLGIEFLRTDLDGSVRLASDGDNWRVMGSGEF